MTESTLGNSIATQIGIIVRDIEVKARAWSNILGLPMPEIIITNTLDKTRAEYNGKPTTARAKLAFFHMGGLDVELIEPIRGPSIWMDQLDQLSDSLYHIAFQIKGMHEKAAYLSSQGVPLLQRGEYTGGRYASLDGVPQLGTILELLGER